MQVVTFKTQINSFKKGKIKTISILWYIKIKYLMKVPESSKLQ